MKAVIIVGPASSSTSEYLAEGERIARQAQAQGMDVRRIFTPRATWARVKANIQGAKLVVYLGHGNGWPSPYAPFRGESKDGLGLNPCENCGTSAPTRYYGEDYLRSQIRLAPKAVVYLHRLCYASGNGEGGMAPVFDKNLATNRTSNFASGFLGAGAGVVFALGWRQRIDLPAALARSDRTMDEIFMTRGSDGDYYDGFQGWDDYYRASTRDAGARVHLDPHPRHGHLRAITGNLTLTAAQWRGDAAAPDDPAPILRVRSTGTSDGTSPAGSTGSMVKFSPNGDGVEDRLVIGRTLSESARVRMEVRNSAGRLVRHVTRPTGKGPGRSWWSGRDQAGRVVRDGVYTVRLTPRDRADNLGRARSVKVRVLGVITRPAATATVINVRDGDGLAAATRLRTSLRQRAHVRWEIRRDGRRVRSLFEGSAPVGRLAVRWDGTDDAGRPVRDGTYTAVLTATTKVGTARFASAVTVRPYVLTLEPRVPARGRVVTIRIESTERQASPPIVEISQPGLRPYRVRSRALDATHAIGRVALRAGGAKGTMTIRVIGTDAGGQVERRAYARELR